MAIEAILITILIFLIAYIIFSLPLYFGLIIMGRHQSILKVGIVNLLAIIINGAIFLLFGKYLESTGFIGMLIPFIITIFFYREMFKIKFWRAFFVLILQYILAVIIYFIAIALGISLLVL